MLIKNTSFLLIVFILLYSQWKRADDLTYIKKYQKKLYEQYIDSLYLTIDS